jgi:wobble nucleotide-excising tRNase
MFLKRIKEIKNIGKFCNVTNIAGIEFSATTIIYANNGNGKSTFTSILRSLHTGNNKILIGKKTLGSNGAKKIEIDFEDNPSPLIAKFESKKWSIPPNDRVFIFDSKFISENIFDGEKLGDDHKANLHKVVVGAEGKKYAEIVSEAMVKVKKCEQSKRDLSAQYTASVFSKIYTLDDFLKIKKDDEIDKKIEEKKQELQFANQFNKPADLKLRSPNLLSISTVLEKKIESLHDDVEKKIKDHADKHLVFSGAGVPLLNAVNNMKLGENCPFCGQDTSAVSDLMDAYKTYFDKSYQDLQKEISETRAGVTSWDIEGLITILLEEIESWNKILNNKPAYEKITKYLKGNNLKQSRDNLLLEIEKKSKDFNYVVPEEIINTLTQSISEIQTEIGDYNVAIRAFKSKVSSKKSEDLQKELQILETTEERHSLKWVKFSDDYAANEEATKAFKIERKTATDNLSTYSQKTFATYQVSINKILEKIGADFKIKDLSEQKDFRKAEAVFCGFDLEFFGQHKVPLSGTEEEPHFKNTLSEGDKGSLAFAFFISVLSNTDTLKYSMVVFDDPISSFDSERKKATAQILSAVTNHKNEQPAQTIILTHESNFLLCLYTEFPSALYLEITQDGISGVVKGSNFTRLNVYEKFIKPHAFELLDNMKQCIDGNNPVDKDAHTDCRLVLENALEAKYYLELKNDMAAHKGLTSYVETLVTGGQMTQVLGDEVKKLLPDIHAPHHSVNGVSQRVNSSGDIKTIIRGSLDLLKKI